MIIQCKEYVSYYILICTKWKFTAKIKRFTLNSYFLSMNISGINTLVESMESTYYSLRINNTYSFIIHKGFLFTCRNSIFRNCLWSDEFHFLYILLSYGDIFIFFYHVAFLQITAFQYLINICQISFLSAMSVVITYDNKWLFLSNYQAARMSFVVFLPCLNFRILWSV